MGMDNVFPGIEFNPKIHGIERYVKASYDISWNQEVILVQKEFSLQELHDIQQVIGKDPKFKDIEINKEGIISEYRNILKQKN